MIIPKEQIASENLIVDEYRLVYSSNGETLLGSTQNLTAGKIVIKDGTKVIGEKALFLYDDFEIDNAINGIELEIADSVEVIEDFGFDNLALAKVRLPKNLKKIGLYAFNQEIENTPHYIQPVEIFNDILIYANDSNLELLDQIKVRNLTLVGKYDDCEGHIIDFHGRKDLESITIDIHGCTIEPGAFCGCDNLKSINLHHNICVKVGAFDETNPYRIHFVNLSLPSGTLWVSRTSDKDDVLGVLPNEDVYIENIGFNTMPSKPTRDQMKELYSSCTWVEVSKCYKGTSQYNGQEILLSKEDYKKIWEAYSIQYRYEYKTVRCDNPQEMDQRLEYLGKLGFDIVCLIPRMHYNKNIGGDAVAINASELILRRKIKL